MNNQENNNAMQVLDEAPASQPISPEAAILLNERKHLHETHRLKLTAERESIIESLKKNTEVFTALGISLTRGNDIRSIHECEKHFNSLGLNLYPQSTISRVYRELQELREQNIKLEQNVIELSEQNGKSVDHIVMVVAENRKLKNKIRSITRKKK